MKKIIIILLIFAFSVSIGFSYFNVNTYLKRCQMQINKINLQRAYQLYNKGGYIFLDVREPNEIKKRGTIPNSIRIPRGLLEFRINNITHNNLNTRIIIFSNSTKRATLAAYTLHRTLGYTQIYRLDGGYEGWKRSGYPTTTKNTKPNKSNIKRPKRVIKKIIIKK